MGTVDFDVFDADNHYYEATDAFIRHLPKHRSKLVQWAEIDGKQRMIVDNKIFRFIPNPTFDPGRPARLPRRLLPRQAGRRRHPRRVRRARADQPRVPRARGAREADGHAGHAGCFLFPTLGVGVEEALLHDPDALHDVFHAFNEWMLDDWTFNYDDRIYAAPYIALQDPERAEQEVEYALENGAHVVVMRSGPGARSRLLAQPGDRGVRPRCGRGSPRPACSPRTTRATRATTATPTSGAAAATSRRSATTRSAASPAATARSTTRSPRSRATACCAATRTCASRRSRAAPTGCRCCCRR